MENYKYEEDFYGWANEQANFIRNGNFKNIDINNLIEEIECLARRERRAIISHLSNLLKHLLKKEYQPAYATPSWDESIRNSRRQFIELLEENPSLKPELYDFITKSYANARFDASVETHIEEKCFPKECPWTIEEIFLQK